MTDSNTLRENFKTSDRATLSLLSALENEEALTQRGLAQHIGVALGMTNGLLKRAVRKGLVKVSEAPARRFSYYVTPKGFGEKSRLVAEYLTDSLSFFRQGREEYAALFKQLQSCGLTRVALFGGGELAEIATLSAFECDSSPVGVIRPGANQKHMFGLDVIHHLGDAAAMDFDAVVIACADDPQQAYETLRDHFEDRQIFTVPLLHVTRTDISGGG